MRVKQAMQTNVRTIGPDRPLTEAAEEMKRFSVKHLVVVERHVPIGVLAHDDIVSHSAEGTVASAMTTRVVTIHEDELIRHAANLMRGHGVRSLVVVTKDEKKLQGIITSTDVLEIISRTGHKERMVLRDRGPKKRYSRTSPPPAKHS